MHSCGRRPTLISRESFNRGKKETNDILIVDCDSVETYASMQAALGGPPLIQIDTMSGNQGRSGRPVGLVPIPPCPSQPTMPRLPAPTRHSQVMETTWLFNGLLVMSRQVNARSRWSHLGSMKVGSVSALLLWVAA